MNRQKIIMFIGCLILILTSSFFQTAKVSADTTLKTREILSIKTGQELGNIGNQFVGVTLDPYNGFAVDSKGAIIISDTNKHRVTIFSLGTKIPRALTVQENGSLFFPDSLCLTEDDTIYVHDMEQQRIIAFSNTGSASIYDNFNSISEENKKINILSLECGKTTIKVAFGIYDLKNQGPVYVDEYDKDFKLINRKVFEKNELYFESKEEMNRIFEKRFVDLKGNMYGYPIVTDWYGKFLPLQKYSSEGILIRTIDGTILTKSAKLNIYDYFKINFDWSELKGKDFLIANWHVTSSGDIYVLIANKDYLKVLLIE